MYCMVIVHKIILYKVQFLSGQFLIEKLNVLSWNFSNYFMKIIVLSPGEKQRELLKEEKRRHLIGGGIR